MCPNSDAATAIDAYGVRWCYADVAELGQASRAFEAVAGEDRGNIVRDHFPPAERVDDVSDAERIEDLSYLSSVSRTARLRWHHRSSSISRLVVRSVLTRRMNDEGYYHSRIAADRQRPHRPGLHAHR